MKNVWICLVILVELIMLVKGGIIINRHQVEEKPPCIWVWYPWYPKYHPWYHPKAPTTTTVAPSSQTATAATEVEAVSATADASVTQDDAETTTVAEKADAS